MARAYAKLIMPTQDRKMTSVLVPKTSLHLFLSSRLVSSCRGIFGRHTRTCKGAPPQRPSSEGLCIPIIETLLNFAHLRNHLAEAFTEVAKRVCEALNLQQQWATQPPSGTEGGFQRLQHAQPQI